MSSTATTARLTLSSNKKKDVLPVTTDTPKIKLMSPELKDGRRKLVGRLRKLNGSASSKTMNKFSVPGRAKSFDGITGLIQTPDSVPLLPDRAPDASSPQLQKQQRKQRQPRSQIFRAVEGGRKDVLPQSTASPKQPLRSRSRSSNSTLTRASFTSFSRVASDQLRSRKKSVSQNRSSMDTSFNDSGSFDEMSVDASFPRYPGEREQQQRNNSSSGKRPLIYADDVLDNSDELSVGTHKKQFPPATPFTNLFRASSSSNTNNSNRRNNQSCPPTWEQGVQKWLNMKKPQFITLMLLLGITCFVAGSYHQVLRASDVIEDVKMGESKLLVHMHKVEQQALQFAENLKRLNDRHDGVAAFKETTSDAPQVDGDLIRSQIDKLREMESELDHEVQTLRKRIQVSAKQSLVDMYGEGAVQVFLDVQAEDENGENDGKRHTIAIRLWYDTPHSAWTFLQQIQGGIWKGATFSLQQGRSLVAEPSTGGPLRPSLDFVESSDRGHERYTITLTDTALSINLQDNRKLYRQEACVGVIFEGFDVLHNIVKDTTTKTVKIVQVTASHMKQTGAMF